MRHITRWAPIALITFAGLVARHVWFTPRPVPAPAAAATGRTETEPRTRIFAGGIVEGAQRELSLRFEVPGRIRTVYVRQGDTVRAGDLLAELETDVAELNLAEAGVRLKIAVAERDLLLADARRFGHPVHREILPAADTQVRGAVPVFDRGQNTGWQQPVDRQESPVTRLQRDGTAGHRQSVPGQGIATDSPLSREEQTIADAKISLADAAVRRAQLFLEKCRLRAPVAGVVLRATFEPGELTGPTDDGAVLTLVNRDAITVRAFVEELDALRVSPGQRAVVSAAGHPDQSYLGVVRSCSPDVHPKSHRHLKPGERLDVRVREVVIELDDGRDLLIGLPVEVFIEPTGAADAPPHLGRASDAAPHGERRIRSESSAASDIRR